MPYPWKSHARGRRKPGEMNKTEAAYAEILETQRIAGDIEWYAFEAITLKLAKDCRYTPDFLVMRPTGYLEIHEVKGFWEDDAKAKFRVAADKFPFRFLAVKKRAKKDGGGWAVEEF